MDQIIGDIKLSSDPYRYVVTTIIPAWHKLLVEAHIVNPEAPNPEDSGSDIFIAHKGRCFSISLAGNGSINALENVLPVAFGCGGSLALAALKGLQYQESNSPEYIDSSFRWIPVYPTKDQLKNALEIVATINLACDNNVDIISE